MHNLKKQSGFGLLETLISLGIFAVLTLGVYSLVLLSLKITSDNKNYVEAINIANQKMERIRNLPYSSVGLTTGIPNGVIPEYENVNRANMILLVHTSISYYDDPYDSVQDGGTDPLGTDYKVATVNVSWQGRTGQKDVTVFSKIIPKTEEMSTGGGILKIIVVDANGVPVPGATIHVENNAIAPIINFDSIADSDGKASFPGAPAAYQSYEITVSKSGYSTEKTYPRTATATDPVKPHLSVIAGTKTEESFTIDKLSSVNIQVVTQEAPDNIKTNTDSSGENQTNPTIDIDSSGNRYFVWQDYRSASAAKIYAQKYSSAGVKQWTPDDIVISPANNQVFPDVKIDNFGNLYVAWNDDSNGNQDAFLDKRLSLDGSSAWATKKVDTVADAKDQTHIKIAIQNLATSSNSIITYQDDRNVDQDIFLHGYDYSRNKLWTNEIRVNDDTIANGKDQYDANLDTGIDNGIFVSWTDERNGNPDIYAQKFSSTGTKAWSNNIMINSTMGSTSKQYSSDMFADNSGNIYFVWTDERNGNPDIYAQAYDATGTKLWTDDIMINSQTGSTSKQYSPDMVEDNSGNIYITWTDERNGNPDIYAQKINNSGSKLWTNDVRVNINTGSSQQTEPSIAIDPVTNKPYVSWYDNRNGDYDIYSSELAYPGEIRNITQSVPLIITGTKLIYNTPSIVKYSSRLSTDTTGLLYLPLEWDVPGYNISLNSASTSLTLLMTDPVMPALVMPNESRDIYLYVK